MSINIQSPHKSLYIILFAGKQSIRLMLEHTTKTKVERTGKQIQVKQGATQNYTDFKHILKDTNLLSSSMKRKSSEFLSLSKVAFTR